MSPGFNHSGGVRLAPTPPGVPVAMTSISRAFPSRHVADEHQAIMNAVLSDDADAAVILLTAHYN